MNKDTLVSIEKELKKQNTILKTFITVYIESNYCGTEKNYWVIEEAVGNMIKRLEEIKNE